ncbi:ATPase [Vibrio sp. JPW-9-11-11]|uniref:ATPase n=1 Tax=Vibrio sp. JPW-9-11-11 TaxID=1416532 RepID=UPI001592B302|nr:ATPase [Vibrio sp. JPW-9-11-11]NVD06023.1 ATPase [Vibrio sp. JPW-9-11-11]
MNKSFYSRCTLVGLLLAAVASWSYADNPAFPPVDERAAEAEQQPSRFFVKYHQGTEQQVKALVHDYQLELVDTLEKQQVLVVSGDKAQIKQLSRHELIDYVEPEPVRSLYSQ